MKINQREKNILDVIENDIKKTDEPYSTLTNSQIGLMLNMSQVTSRDKVAALVKKGYLQRVENFWTPEGKFYNRVLYKGKSIN